MTISPGQSPGQWPPHPTSAGPFTPGQPFPPPRGGWWSRNWKWVLPVGCLLPILICGGLITAMAALGFSLIKSSEPYQHGLNAAKANSAVIAAIGSPVEAGVLVNGKIHTTNDSGDADLAIPVSGPKGSGKVFVTATRSAGVWSYSAVVFKADGSPKRINLEPTPTP